MHFIFGGAYNGKSKWVKNEYRHLDGQSVLWISAYRTDEIPKILPRDPMLIVIEGFELFIKQHIDKRSSKESLKFWRDKIAFWIDWEKQNEQRKVIVIGTDISKGIVPMEPSDRQWRDETGWVYQDLVKVADRVDLIWYGLASQLK